MTNYNDLLPQAIPFTDTFFDSEDDGRPVYDKKKLVGVPHIITAVTLRYSKNSTGDYASVEATTDTSVDLVYNTSGKVMRRQLVAHLINFPQEPVTVEEIDRPFWEWDGVDPDAQYLELTTDKNGDPLRLLVPRGLRVTHNEKYNRDMYYLTN